jgi:hypothetical protein
MTQNRWIAINPSFIFLVLIGLALLGNVRVFAGEVNPVIFRIIADESEISAEAREITVEAELLNTSNHSIKLSPAGIGAQVTLSNIPCSLGEDIWTQTRNYDPNQLSSKTNLVVIRPGQTFRKQLKVKLTSDASASGVHSLRMVFSGGFGGGRAPGVFTGDLISNEILFYVAEKEAGAPPLTKP